MRVERTTWDGTVELRRTVLGWGREPVPGDLDPTATHLVALDEDQRTLGVVSYLPHACPERPGAVAVYLWAMAVAPDRQRGGIGRELLGHVLADAQRTRAAVVWADARATAVPFYRRCGGVTVGTPYRDEVTGLVDRRVVFEPIG